MMLIYLEGLTVDFYWNNAEISIAILSAIRLLNLLGLGCSKNSQTAHHFCELPASGSSHHALNQKLANCCRLLNIRNNDDINCFRHFFVAVHHEHHYVSLYRDGKYNHIDKTFPAKYQQEIIQQSVGDF